MRTLKVLICIALLASLAYVVIEISMAYGLQVHKVFYGSTILWAALVGGYLARFITWGWLLGSLGGLVVGFYLPMPLMYFMPTTGYEKVLPWLMLTASLGLVIGGYSMDKWFKSNRKSRS